LRLAKNRMGKAGGADTHIFAHRELLLGLPSPISVSKKALYRSSGEHF
jgi:hypothetical protein